MNIDATEIGVFLGVDIAKEEHFCHAVTAAGDVLFSRAVANSEAGLDGMIDQAEEAGRTVLVIDTTSSAARLLLGAAARRGAPVAYVPGLVMRRAADLYAGSAKTDPRDAFVLADYARRNPDRLLWVETTDEALTRMRILAGRDEDLAADSTRTINRLRDALVAVSPGLERVLGSKLHQKAVREVLKRWPTPAALRTAGRTRIRNLLKKHYPRKPHKGVQLAERVWAEVNAQTVALPGEATWGEVITQLAGNLEQILAERSRLAATIEEVFLAHPLARNLLTIPGVGPKPAPASSPRSVTPTASPTDPASLPTPGSPPSPAAPAGRSTPPAATPAGTNASKTPCTGPRSQPPNTTPTPEPTTNANEPKAKTTPPPSSTSPAADATSYSPSSKTKPPTTHHPNQLDKPTGTRPRRHRTTVFGRGGRVAAPCARSVSAQLGRPLCPWSLGSGRGGLCMTAASGPAAVCVPLQGIRGM